jgi:hypothetical protein
MKPSNLTSRFNFLYYSRDEPRTLSLTALVKVKVEVTLRLTVSQSVCRSVEPSLGLMTRYSLLLDSYGLVLVGHPL